MSVARDEGTGWGQRWGGAEKSRESYVTRMKRLLKNKLPITAESHNAIFPRLKFVQLTSDY